MSDLSNKKLIYADDIFRYIKAEINPYGKPLEGSAYELGLKVMRYIENMSAAYDADKIIEQISKAKDEYGMVDYINGKPVIAKEQAIEIIKKGGIE